MFTTMTIQSFDQGSLYRSPYREHDDPRAAAEAALLRGEAPAAVSGAAAPGWTLKAVLARLPRSKAASSLLAPAAVTSGGSM